MAPRRPPTIEIQVYGCNGGDTDLAGDMLADALRRVGYHVRTHAARGERQGFLVVRAARDGTEEFTSGRRAHGLLVLGAELLAGIPAAALVRPDLVVVDAPLAPCGRLPAAAAVLAVDATGIARRHAPGVTAIAALLGAFAGASDVIPIEPLVAAVERLSRVAKRANADACVDAYTEAMAAQSPR